MSRSNRKRKSAPSRPANGGETATLTASGATDRLRFSKAKPPSLKLFAIALTLLLNEPTPRCRPPFHGSGGNWRRFTVSGVIVVHCAPLSTIIVTGDPLISAATIIGRRAPTS